MTTYEVKPASDVDLRRDGTPIYVQLAALFRRRIETGEWAVGQQIPTLDMLALEFGVARATVRQTTGLLMQEGLIARYRGRGTIVLNRPQREFWYEVGADWDEIVRAYRHEGFESEVLDSREAAPLPPDYVKEPLAENYRFLRRLNRVNGEPAALDAIWVDETCYRTLGDAALREVPTLLLLHEKPDIHIDRVMQTLTVASTDVELSTLLRIPLNAPLAVVHRSLYDKRDRLLCLYQSFNRGDTFRLKMRLK